ncbi:uncharacterized protein F5891DRAFT_1198234 [Suillus fuscotomentosus]|uniref:Uncharacterized protein n=1 Tax=Suillus fuscotomentosus TaxID=1912939 RepID=A0AAD4DQQ5_9AGAM|nr:uncharacterized protein F5891DRAFT_1198234 [Suillus fuscotomentosus]KAG1890427.1 hypothetical protein F5891DRAFT_1198234 [Suillus fuscotomentosus]
MPTVTTRSGHYVKHPPLPDEPKTCSKAVDIHTESDADTIQASIFFFKSIQPRKHPHPRRRPGPKSVMVDNNNNDNNPQESSITRRHPPPKPCPLAWSKCSGPMTSSAEEGIFEASFSRHSSVIPKTPDVATDQQSCLSHVQLADGTSLTCAEFASLADEEICTDTQDGNIETTPALVTEAHSTTVSKDPNPASEVQSNDPNGGTSATPTESYNTGHGSKDHGKDTSAAHAESHSAEDGGNNSAIPATGRPCRSCGVTSYAPDRNDGEESSPSDSDWAADQELCKKAQRAAVDAAANDGDNDDGSPASNPPSPSQLTARQKQKSKVMVDVNEHNDSKDEDDKDFVKIKGRIPQAGISKAQELGKNMMEAARAIGKEYGKSARTILIEAGLMMKATWKESPWNQHQMWFAVTCPPPKGVLGAVSPADLKAWKHSSVWKEILENWDRAVMVKLLFDPKGFLDQAQGSEERKYHENLLISQTYTAGSTEDLTSRSAAGLMMAVRDAFTKSAAYWHRTHGIHIAGVAIFPGDKEAGCQASGLFASSDMVKALINSHQLDIKCWLDELTTILKYKDLEATVETNISVALQPSKFPSSQSIPNIA